MGITIRHNPARGTSRNVLAMIRATGAEPVVVECLAHPPTRERLEGLIGEAGLIPREALREKGTPFPEMGLADPALTDDAILDAMLAQPILINRPFVQTPKGVRLCRPSEVALDLLDAPLPAGFAKEDGEVVRAAR